ncbi:glycerophosphodiester phosphodiesterase [Alsobacter sp. SYSU M60028]|uniref:Glycerophosphodiester phosphodiesterase n=1 Tax=Alsobacter ponti TaxID=2962936 RepID=A0ABT1LFZ2_9HYPH|nr:glycerophosphodiester phosphodiesterase family protein [Alsobacter ponti]MCP8939876.1 glycerophosphodiester phosphodiesterase [Alsobacter ponti]
MAAPAWLTARPIAHRGLHDRKAGVIENSIGAARAAIAGGFAIECDVQLTRDLDAVVFHDWTLDRLTAATGRVVERTAAELAGLTLRDSADAIPTLAAFLGELAGRTPLVLEIKSAFNGDLRLARRVAEVVGAYNGPVALKSFDPDVVAALRDLAPDRPRGVVGEHDYEHGEWEALTPARKHALRNLLHWPDSRPDFLSWQVKDLETAPPFLARHAIGVPVMSWTVRTPAQRELAAAHADQMVFEGFTP